MKEIFRSKNWDDFKRNIRGLTTKEKGDAFELLVKSYLLLEPRYLSLLQDVWLFDEIPISIHQKLNLPARDMGIDLIAETKENQYWAIQCKYRDNEQEHITWRELSTFAGLAFSNKNISYALLCSTTEKVTEVIDRIDNIGIRSIEVWRHLDNDFFDRVRAFQKQKPTKLVPFRPRHHQRRAIENANKHFIKEGNQRGKLIMPSGTGKSLTAFWIADNFDAQIVIIALPSLSLMSQTINVWLREYVANNKELNWIAVCSDQTVVEAQKDELSIFTQDLGIPVETDVNKITNWLKKNQDEKAIIFTTYQSGKVIADASSKAEITYDFGIFDEAHKTVGRKGKLFSYLLFDENIQINNRMFMTATERRYAGSKSDKILSMDNSDIYGDTFELLSYKEALQYEPPILSDYRIVTIVVDESEIEQLIEQNIFVTSDRLNIDIVLEAGMLASAIALRKAMKRHPITHTVSFHRSIKRSKMFRSIQDSISEAVLEYRNLETFHVDGKMSSGKRDRIINEFTHSNRSLISNARCLTEGIDVKKIDCVLFADPKKSRIDIVQAFGRALRPLEGKEYGYIIIPIITKDGKFEHTAFDEILILLRGLAANDERIIEYFRAKSNNKRPFDNIVNFDIDEKFALNIDTDEFIKSIETICWKSIAKLSWRPFIKARAFVHSLGLKNVIEWVEYCKSGEKPDDIPADPPGTYKNEGWKGYGDWLGTGFIAHKWREFRPFKEARAFVHNLNLTSQTEYRIEYCKSGNKPDDIPTNPNIVYKNEGWKGYGDWLGTGTIAPFLRVYKPFKEARAFIHSLKLNNNLEWREYCKSVEKPDDIPSNPNKVYKNKGWAGWGDWIGTGTIAPFLREYKPFKEARAFVNSLNLTSQTEWQKYCNTGEKPDDIPTAPNRVYKNEGWKGYGDWLRTGTIASKFREYKQFKEARDFVHSLGLKNTNEWQEYCKSGKRPDDIPSNPNRVYKNEGWKGLGDWLGTGTIAPFLRVYKPFKEARAFVHSLELKSSNEWQEYCISGDKPDEIPSNPNTVYKNEGWKGQGDWLGTGIIATKFRVYKPFKDARAFVHSLRLKSRNEWQEYCKSEKKPDEIPAHPQGVYKNEGWKGYGDWLGTGTIASFLREYRPFKEARAFVHSLNITSQTEWRIEYCKSGKKPDDIPTAPDRVYKNEGWKGYGDWLGTGIIASRFRTYKPFKEARAFVHELGLKGNKEWREYCKSGNKPDDIPTAPNTVYKNKGWKGFGDWLGTGTIAPFLRVYKPFKEARAFVHSLELKSSIEWQEYCKSGNKPDDIPVAPQGVYKNEGWKGYGDWLGTGTIAPFLRAYKPFKEARAFVHSLGLKGDKEWKEYCKSGEKPFDIPTTPRRTYKNNGWKGIRDWVGKN